MALESAAARVTLIRVTTTKVITVHLQFAHMATTIIIPTHARLTDTTGRTGSPAGSLSAQVHGSTAAITGAAATMAAAGAVLVIMDADLIAAAHLGAAQSVAGSEEAP